jgi:DNA-binding SARP family transcriptional activator/Tfp pilus assembly protein PilF
MDALSDSTPVLRIHLLGGLDQTWDNAALPPIPSAAARSLFAYLVTYRDRSHTRDLLAGTFWPDLSDAAARRRLSQALWQIRKAQSPHTILLAEGDTIQVNASLSLWIDVEEFERLVAGGIGNSADGPPTNAIRPPGHQPTQLESLNRAVELYRGDFLAGYYDDWIFLERERLRETFLSALEHLVSHLKAQGSYEQALSHARRLAGEDPLREEAHREVMRLCHLLGRDNEALQQYQDLRQIMAEELAVEPSASTSALADELAGMVEEAEIPYLPVPGRSSPLPFLERPDQVPLVGRQAERAELVRRLELAASGQGGLVLLVGGAGEGKTRLMQEVARDADWRGIRVAWGRNCEMYAPPPYQPLVEILNDSDLGRLPEVWRRELARLMPELAPALPELEPEQERGRLVEALARAFLTLSQAEPHLIILEDVHWMDTASFEALGRLLPRLSASRLLVVATLRPEELVGESSARQSLAGLETTRIPRRLTLVPLTATETGALIQRVLDHARSAPRFSQRLYDRTRGNPFFITETLRSLVDEGLLYRNEGGEWTTPWDDATNNYSELPVPASIAQSIEQRLAQLSPATLDLIGIAAVIGRQVEFDLWLAACDCDEDTTLAAAEELERRGLLSEMDDVLGYRFVHDTIREVTYENLSPVRRRLWHRRVAAALESLHPDQAEALTLHYRLGQNWPEAVRCALQAGQRAQAVYANQQALDYYQNADAWLAQGRVVWPAAEIAGWRANLAESQGRIHSLVGEYEAAEAAFDQARRTWADLDNWRGEARVLNRLSFLHFNQKDHDGTNRYARMALDVLAEADPPLPSHLSDDSGGGVKGSVDLRAASMTYLGLSAWTQGRYDEALHPLEQALALYEQIGNDLYGQARCLISLGMVHLEREDLVLAEDCFSRSLALRQQIGDRRGEAWCRLNQGRTALQRGELAAAQEKLEAAQAIFAEIEHPYGIETTARYLDEVAQAGIPPSQQTGPGSSQSLKVHLPRAGAPSGRPLQDDEFVSVAWTVVAPGDEIIPGKADRRRHCLLRLLQEAEAQGAAPTLEDLATALEVSQPTIKRDLAALRQAGHQVHTRGSRGG